MSKSYILIWDLKADFFRIKTVQLKVLIFHKVMAVYVIKLTQYIIHYLTAWKKIKLSLDLDRVLPIEINNWVWNLKQPLVEIVQLD